MSLKELGEKLREERERQGLSIDDVQQRSKIAPNVLEAIEQGRQEVLPHPVYVRGFIKTYASVLGLDAEDPELGLDTIFQGEEPPRSKIRKHKPLTEVTPYPMQREPRRSNKLWILLVLLLLAAGGGYFIWQSLQSAEPPAEENATVAPEAPSEPAPAQPSPERSPATGTLAPAAPALPDEAGANATGAAPQVEEEVADIAQTIESAMGEEGNATRAEAGETAEDEDANATATDENPLEVSEAAVAEAAGELDAEEQALYEQALDTEPVVVHTPAQGGDQTVQILALEPCWIGFTIDQEAPKDFYLYAGQRAVVRFDKTLLLRLGNAGGVRFLYNGEPFTTSYVSGEVRELRFPPTPE